MEISRNKSEFVDMMINFKNEVEKTLDKYIYFHEIEDIRLNSQGRFSKERFKEYLVKKTALHITFQYIFIRIASESQNLVKAKFNDEAIMNWKELSKNYRQDYYMLYRLACDDLRRQEETANLFEHCIYDDYTSKLDVSFFNNKQENYLDKLRIYDFKTFDPNIAVSLFDLLYPSDDREKLKEFLDESKVTTELMKSLGLL